MEYVNIKNIHFPVSRLGLGTWAIGGSLWGGTDKEESIKTILQAIEKGINLLDTAPAYGNGESEEIVGAALKQYKKRDSLVIATKFGLQIEGNTVRDLRKASILKELDASLKRLHVDYIDLYQAHWPDPKAPIEELAEAINLMLSQGKIRAAGVCNFSIEEMNDLKTLAPFASSQFPFNLYEQEQASLIDYCKKEKLTSIGYGSICRGMLSGKMSKKRHFPEDDLRSGMDPKFKEPHFSQYLEANQKLEEWLQKKHQNPLIALAMRWVLDKGIDIALWGARKPSQLENLDRVFDWTLDASDFQEIDEILQVIQDPASNDFMGPPLRP